MHDHDRQPAAPNGGIALVGHANVGKSALFQQLTGTRTVISNYPGTTIEIISGTLQSDPPVEIIDTPGILTLPAQSEDEAITARILLGEGLRGVIQVGDAKNLTRTLALSIILSELGLPFVLALNMIDEARQRGIQIEPQKLIQTLGVPVIPTIAIKGEGISQLHISLASSQPAALLVCYPAAIEDAIHQMAAHLPAGRLNPRGMALLLLSGDRVAEEWLLSQLLPEAIAAVHTIIQNAEQAFDETLLSVIQRSRFASALAIAGQASNKTQRKTISFSARLGRLTMHPLWGLPVLVGVLAIVFWFVGVFGAQVLVNLLEGRLFGVLINPRVAAWVSAHTPFELLREALVGQYGLWSMGLTYAIALVLPIVTTFFFAFSIIEDSGYLPRLAALSNGIFKRLGLNGKAILPMVLGLGCVTMATVTTRTLESKRERFLVTLLLALAVPCSAQLGIVVGMLASISAGAALIWSGVVLLILLVVGWLANKFMPGERNPLFIELPPLRIPQFSNVLLKTVARLEWYLKEVLPLFLAGAAAMFTLDQLGIIDWMISAARPLTVNWLGLPAEASAAFVLGFLRRDFGATGLFLLNAQGLLNATQVVVAMVTITLFIPCIASVLIIAKEHGWRIAAGMVLLIFPLAFLAGGLLNKLLIFLNYGAAG